MDLGSIEVLLSGIGIWEFPKMGGILTKYPK